MYIFMYMCVRVCVLNVYGTTLSYKSIINLKTHSSKVCSKVCSEVCSKVSCMEEIRDCIYKIEDRISVEVCDRQYYQIFY